MERQRKNAPEATSARRRQRGDNNNTTERIRHRIRAEPDVALSPEELRALADEGIDPEDLRRAAAAGLAEQEASPHDRDTPRDQIETLVNDDDYE